MAAEIHQGAGPPYTVDVVVTSDGTPVGLDTVTAAVLDVLHDDGTEAEWACSLLPGATATSLTIRHELDPADLPIAETVTLQPRLTVPSGTLVGRPRKLVVRKPWT